MAPGIFKIVASFCMQDTKRDGIKGKNASPTKTEPEVFKSSQEYFDAKTSFPCEKFFECKTFLAARGDMSEACKPRLEERQPSKTAQVKRVHYDPSLAAEAVKESFNSESTPMEISQPEVEEFPASKRQKMTKIKAVEVDGQVGKKRGFEKLASTGNEAMTTRPPVRKFRLAKRMRKDEDDVLKLLNYGSTWASQIKGASTRTSPAAKHSDNPGPVHENASLGKRKANGEAPAPSQGVKSELHRPCSVFSSIGKNPGKDGKSKQDTLEEHRKTFMAAKKAEASKAARPAGPAGRGQHAPFPCVSKKYSVQGASESIRKDDSDSDDDGWATAYTTQRVVWRSSWDQDINGKRKFGE
eukprot:TRINITY_DN2532_c0_g1_i1.p1 TRINITY_DN2532_c0_g1~~TRINITY_DN2532_c0_g1_i1.p1  ORF type:complete len:355 (-),score=59.42 TRINITY_DN2532_c0_g1_i1:201-1265(-)